ncbi:CaiB/BaiF CoA transferase family protein [Desulfatirhabdium butyrativorans]|uniref:CaiB/BaiF CoA transferase family protein n=1 Tax=Desulfatirhabdium butyrativorans TaxID=340467 RepID=UPI000488A79E|nr:CoA transferase [Desulfatirhabdium butyrativorans]
MAITKPGPLDGIVVLDFTWVLAGPHATKTLADMGAQVIKVERYSDGANERWLPHRATHDGVTQSSYSINVNRGKKSICIDFKKPEGMRIIHDLIRKSDVLIENFAPDVMARMKLDYTEARKIKEDIIYCSISCFGHWGPYSHKPGYDMIAQGASGWTDQSVPPIIAPVSIGDMTASMHATTAILGAIVHHNKTGVGQNIDISMMDCLFSMHENTLPWYLLSSAIGKPIDPPKVGAHHPGYAPYGVYSGKNGSVTIACLTEPRWVPLIKAMGPKYAWLLSEPRAKDVSTRCCTENAFFIHEQIQQWVMEQDSVEEAERILEEVGVPCMRCRSITELADNDPHVREREMIVIENQPFIGPMRHYGSPLKYSETPSGVRGYSPFLGEHNTEVLSGVLGYSDNRIHDLYSQKILHHDAAVERLRNK